MKYIITILLATLLVSCGNSINKHKNIKIPENIKKEEVVLKTVNIEDFNIEGAVKVERLGIYVEEEYLDENLDKKKRKVYEPLRTSSFSLGGGVYKVIFKDGTSKRYYWEFSNGGAWTELDFGPYKN